MLYEELFSSFMVDFVLLSFVLLRVILNFKGSHGTTTEKFLPSTELLLLLCGSVCLILVLSITCQKNKIIGL